MEFATNSLPTKKLPREGRRVKELKKRGQCKIGGKEKSVRTLVNFRMLGDVLRVDPISDDDTDFISREDVPFSRWLFFGHGKTILARLKGNRSTFLPASGSLAMINRLSFLSAVSIANFCRPISI